MLELKTIRIQNFKSIKKIELDIKKHGGSYTTMFLGLNEVGKSNLLEAISYLHPPKGEKDYDLFANQKLEKEELVSLYFDFVFKDKETYLEPIREKINGNENLLDFEIDYITKKVYLAKKRGEFGSIVDVNLKKLSSKLFIKKSSRIITKDNKNTEEECFEISKQNDQENSFEELNEETFKKNFQSDIEEIVKEFEPKVTFWKPTEQYLINTQNLKQFKDSVESNIPLQNIFTLAGYKDSEEIKEVIETALSNDSKRSQLQSQLSEKVTSYVKNIWKHKINFLIEIDQTGLLTVFIHDGGEKNKHDRYDMKQRSDGFKHFISLILSLSIETDKLNMKNRIILIDEAETHLHPSGIRDLGKELVKFGKDNFVFVATHSPFLIDRKNKERNVILKKNNEAYTEIKRIKNDEDIRDDEVLKEAFGIEVYKDLLNSHSILVEGKCDKTILRKALKIKKKDYGIMNGCGDNIVHLVSKLNHSDISLMVILDDDEKGKENRRKIIEVGGVYSSENVFTIRDLVEDIINGGTIEDTLHKEYIKSQFKKFCETIDIKDDFNLISDRPVIGQIKVFLKQKKHVDKLNDFKKQIAENFDPTEKNLDNKLSLLDSLCNKIIEKLENNSTIKKENIK